ncbi:hypothetical protein BaRGS_00002026, partial [Batillaria attramentaria]
PVSLKCQLRTSTQQQKHRCQRFDPYHVFTVRQMSESFVDGLPADYCYLLCANLSCENVMQVLLKVFGPLCSG